MWRSKSRNAKGFLGIYGEARGSGAAEVLASNGVSIAKPLSVEGRVEGNEFRECISACKETYRFFSLSRASLIRRSCGGHEPVCVARVDHRRVGGGETVGELEQASLAQKVAGSGAARVKLF
mgnify:CR=1 FL=1